MGINKFKNKTTFYINSASDKAECSKPTYTWMRRGGCKLQHVLRQLLKEEISIDQYIGDWFNTYLGRSQFRLTGPTFTSLSTDEASVVKYLALRAQTGVPNTQRNDYRVTKR